MGFLRELLKFAMMIKLAWYSVGAFTSVPSASDTLGFCPKPFWEGGTVILCVLFSF